VTRDVFRRLALVAGCSAWAVAVALVWRYVGWPAAVSAIVVGPLGALLLSLELSQPPQDKSPSLDAARQGLSSREISRRAQAAGGADDG